MGAGKTYTSLDQVPWEAVKGGDTVRIFYSATPYKGKILVTGQGTASAPIRVCGVRGPSNERPIIDGNGATSRPAVASLISGDAATRQIHESRSVVLIKGDARSWTNVPQYVQIDGLNITHGHTSHSYTDTGGAKRNYTAFSACVWVDRGHNITIADNEISDCTQAIYTKSTDDGSFSVTKNIRIAGNYMWGHGVVGDEHEHTTYTESQGVVIEFNRYGPVRAGSGGNAIKDRSAGTVVRYNRIEEGAHAIDLVEAEDFPLTALADPAYRSTYVYGNQIKKNGNTGSFIHYGGDHAGSVPGANWGESLFRRGTLYFFNNTIYGTGSYAAIFQISTTLETVQAWNNAFYFDPSVQTLSMRMNQDGVNTAYWTPAGILNLGVNWIRTGWLDTDIYHPIKGQLNGSANLITGSSAPFDLTTLAPLAGSALLDKGQANVSGATGYPVSFQLDSSYKPLARAINGTAIDLGAVER